MKRDSANAKNSRFQESPDMLMPRAWVNTRTCIALHEYLSDTLCQESVASVDYWNQMTQLPSHSNLKKSHACMWMTARYLMHSVRGWRFWIWKRLIIFGLYGAIQIILLTNLNCDIHSRIENAGNIHHVSSSSLCHNVALFVFSREYLLYQIDFKIDKLVYCVLLSVQNMFDTDSITERHYHSRIQVNRDLLVLWVRISSLIWNWFTSAKFCFISFNTLASIISHTVKGIQPDTKP